MVKTNSQKNKRLKIIEKLIENQTICRLLTYDGADALDPSLPDIEDKSGLIMTKLIPLPFVNVVTGFQSTMINVFFGKTVKNGITYKDAQLFFIISSHYNCWVMGEDLRPEIIAEEIKNMINLQHGFGVGKMLYQYETPIPINGADKVFGYQICYQITDFA